MIGIDLVKVERIAKVIENKKFLDKTFSKTEIEYARAKGEINFAQTLAGMFAAKEAVLKALGTGIVDLNLANVEILHSDLGQPYCKLEDGRVVNVSISHDGGMAVAAAMIVK